MSSPARVILSIVTKDGTALIYIAESGALKLEFTGSIAMELSDPVLISELTEAFDRHRSIKDKQDIRQMTFEEAWKKTGFQYGGDALENVKLGWELARKPCCVYGGSHWHNGHEYCTTCGEQLK